MAWYGYVATGAGPYTSVSATFTVPALNTAGSATPSNTLIWVGIDGYPSVMVEQCGIGAFVDPGGAARYQAWHEYSPADEGWWSPAAYPVRAGDSITAAVSYGTARGGSYTTSIANATQGWSASVTKTLAALTVENYITPTLTSAEVIIETDEPENVMANFGTVAFTGVTGLGTSPLEVIQNDQITVSSPWSAGSFSLTWAATS